MVLFDSVPISGVDAIGLFQRAHALSELAHSARVQQGYRQALI
jgi:hypothetical protein